MADDDGQVPGGRVHHLDGGRQRAARLDDRRRQVLERRFQPLVHGHAGGDTALRLLAATLKDFTRRADCVARLGGEEFGVLLPDATRAVAEGIAQRICEQVSRLAILDGEGRRFGLTVSIGLAEALPTDTRPEDLMARADAALYEAKRGGRNRVVSRSKRGSSRSRPSRRFATSKRFLNSSANGPSPRIREPKRGSLSRPPRRS